MLIVVVVFILIDGVDEGKRNNLFLWVFLIKIFSIYDIRY